MHLGHIKRLDTYTWTVTAYYKGLGHRTFDKDFKTAASRAAAELQAAVERIEAAGHRLPLRAH